MPTSHVAGFRLFVNHLHLPWNRYQRQNLADLGGAFLKRPSLPIRRLARTLAGPSRALRAPDKRFRRFLGNPRLDEPALDAALAAALARLLPRLGCVPFIPVMLDWTFLPGRALLWAQIPYEGRSLPLLGSVRTVPLADDETGYTQAEQHLLSRLQACWPKGAPPLLLLMDRGFDKGSLLRWLIQQDYRFIVRVQRGNWLVDPEGKLLNDEYDEYGQLVREGPLHPEPGEVRLFPGVRYYKNEPLAVHLAVSAVADSKTGAKQEWRLITNLEAAWLEQVPRLYGLRMSPEETHRDSKRGANVSGFALSHLGRLRQDRLERYLFMLGLILIFLVLVAETQRAERAWLKERHWGLSLFQFALEVLHAPGSSPYRIARQACASVLLYPSWLPGGYS